MTCSSHDVCTIQWKFCSPITYWYVHSMMLDIIISTPRVDDDDINNECYPQHTELCSKTWCSYHEIFLHHNMIVLPRHNDDVNRKTKWCSHKHKMMRISTTWMMLSPKHSDNVNPKKKWWWSHRDGMISTTQQDVHPMTQNKNLPWQFGLLLPGVTRVPAISSPWLLTHQQCPVLPWHWTGS